MKKRENETWREYRLREFETKLRAVYKAGVALECEIDERPDRVHPGYVNVLSQFLGAAGALEKLSLDY